MKLLSKFAVLFEICFLLCFYIVRINGYMSVLRGKSGRGEKV